jgi:hypothetical protein
MNKSILKNKIREILIKEDPIKIFFIEDNNTDEYNGEVKLILEYLPKINTEQELLEMVYQVFKTRFGNIEATKDIQRYEQLSKDIWQIIKEDKYN